MNTPAYPSTAAVIDVRSSEEFRDGHVAESINIPLYELGTRIDEIRAMSPVVLCCASGGRSYMGTGILRQQGVEAYDGGSWMDVNHHKNN